MFFHCTLSDPDYIGEIDNSDETFYDYEEIFELKVMSRKTGKTGQTVLNCLFFLL